MSRIRKSFSGAAVPTNLNGAITSAASSANVTAIVNFPNTSTGPFVITIDRGSSAEEKILCSSYSANTINFVQRGYDGTTAQGHANGAPVVCTIDADTIDGANDYMAGNGSVAPHASAPGDAAAKGTALYAAAADHVHAREAWGTGQSQQVGSANADGVQTTLARSDHIHQGVTSFNTRQGVVTPGNADYLAVASGGLTGATTPTRYVGGTAGGPPVSGTFAKGDFVIDSTDGAVWVCMVAGSPGTWQVPYPVGIPAGTAYCTAGLTVTGGVAATVAASENLKGGMTQVGTSGSGLQVPVAGLYQVETQIAVQGSLGFLLAGIGKNNAVVKQGANVGGAGPTLTAATATGLVNCAANDVLNLWYTTGATAQTFVISGSVYCYVSAFLVSQ